MTSIVDTDALVAMVHPSDPNHQQADYVSSKLIQHGVSSIILPSTLGEFVTLAIIRIGLTKTKEALNSIRRSDYIHFTIEEEHVREAELLFHQQTSKENSLFDCFNMVAAKALSADCIFSFDHGYTKNGFILAEDWVQSHSS